MGKVTIGAVNCGACGDELEDVPLTARELRTPCPRCGDTRRIFNVGIAATLEARGDLGFAHKVPDDKKPIAWGKHGHSLTKSTGRWAVRTRLFDRRNNTYHERIVEKETGKVLHECDEPLTDHVGHGSAKEKKR